MKFTGPVSPSLRRSKITTFEAFTFAPERPILTWSWDTFTIRGGRACTQCCFVTGNAMRSGAHCQQKKLHGEKE
jgi:hypothetical protein